MADTGQTGTHAPQSIHSTGSMNSMLEPSNCGSSFLGWMQSTGHASTQAASLVPMQGSAITYVIRVKFSVFQLSWLGQLRILTAITGRANLSAEWRPDRSEKHHNPAERGKISHEVGGSESFRDSSPARCDTCAQTAPQNLKTACMAFTVVSCNP